MKKMKRYIKKVMKLFKFDIKNCRIWSNYTRTYSSN